MACVKSATPCRTRCARQGLNIVEDFYLHRILGLGRGDCRLPCVLDRRLLGREEAGPHVDADRPKHERRRNAASVKDPAGRDHRDGRNGIDDLRDESHRADDAAIAARLAALRDNYVGATLSRFDRLRNRRDLDHHFRADVVGLPHEIARIPKSERYDGGPRS